MIRRETPTTAILTHIDHMQVLHFVDTALALCENHAASITSWYRTPKRNASVNGAQESQHTRGLAVDLLLDNDTREARAALINDAQAAGLEVIVESTHLHVQLPRV